MPAGRESIANIALDRSGASSVCPHGTSDWEKQSKLQANRIAPAAISRVFMSPLTSQPEKMFPNRKGRMLMVQREARQFNPYGRADYFRRRDTIDRGTSECSKILGSF